MPVPDPRQRGCRRHPRAPLIVGLLGGVGSGKSRVAGMLERRGAWRIDADLLAHEVLDRPGVLRQIRRAFGDAVFSAAGVLDRAALAARTFGRPAQLRALERLIHPAVERMLRFRLREIRRQRSSRLVVLDVPLLVESGWARKCDVLVFVRAPDAVRDRRVRESREWPRRERIRRERRQFPLKAKESMADFIIDNGADARATSRQVRRLVRTLLSP